MRVRPHIDALAGQEFGRPGLVEENERPDHLPLRRRQGAPDLETAEVAGTRNDQGFDRVGAHLIGAARLHGWVPAHASHPFLGSGWLCASPMRRRMPGFDQSAPR